MLDPVFDFKALTEAEAYQKTLPPKVQEAIKNHQVLVGMDRDMVIYAKGRPGKKIRDKDDNGTDYEEWIYGTRRRKWSSCRFQGDVVNRLEIMTVDGQKVVRTEKEVDLQSKETHYRRARINPPRTRRPSPAGREVENTGALELRIRRIPRRSTACRTIRQVRASPLAVAAPVISLAATRLIWRAGSCTFTLMR